MCRKSQIDTAHFVEQGRDYSGANGASSLITSLAKEIAANRSPFLLARWSILLLMLAPDRKPQDNRE